MRYMKYRVSRRSHDAMAQRGAKVPLGRQRCRDNSVRSRETGTAWMQPVRERKTAKMSSTSTGKQAARPIDRKPRDLTTIAQASCSRSNWISERTDRMVPAADSFECTRQLDKITLPSIAAGAKIENSGRSLRGRLVNTTRLEEAENSIERQ